MFGVNPDNSNIIISFMKLKNQFEILVQKADGDTIEEKEVFFQKCNASYIDARNMYIEYISNQPPAIQDLITKSFHDSSIIVKVLEVAPLYYRRYETLVKTMEGI